MTMMNDDVEGPANNNKVQSGPVVEEEETKEESRSSSPQQQKEEEDVASEDNNDNDNDNNNQANPESSAPAASAASSAESSNNDDEKEDDDEEEEEPSCGSVIRDGIIEFSVEPIKNQLLCSLCEGLYKEPYRTMKCHHTFCKSCLRIGLQSCLGTPEHNCCPSCKTYLGGKSDIATVAVPDRVLETIIDKIFFPEIAQADAQAERGIPLKQPSITANEEDPSENDGEDNNNNDGLDSSAVSMGRGHKKRKRHSQRRSVADSSDDDAFDSTMGTKIMFHLLPEENAADDAPPPLESPFLRTDGSIRIGQLKKYIRNTIEQQRALSDPELLSPKQLQQHQNHHHHADGDEEDEEEEDVVPNTTNTTRTRAMDTSEERAVALLIEFHRSPERRPADRDLEILCNSIPLGNELSVNFVWRTVWIDHSKKLTLYYRYADAKR